MVLRIPGLIHTANLHNLPMETEKVMDSDENMSAGSPQSDSGSSLVLELSPLTTESLASSKASLTATRNNTPSPNPVAPATTAKSPKQGDLSVPLPAYRSPSSSSAREGIGKDLKEHAGHEATTLLPTGKQEHEKQSSCSSEESWKSPISLISPMVVSGGGGDPKIQQGLETMPLSNYVKLMNLDVPGGLSVNYHELSGLRPLPQSTSSSAAAAISYSHQTSSHMVSGPGHMIRGASHMMGSRGGIKPDYHPPSRGSLSVAAPAPTFFIPSHTQTGIIALQDTRANPVSGFIDIGPPSFSPGPAAPVAPPSVNFFPPQPPASSSTSPRQQSGPQTSGLQGPRLGKRPHDLLTAGTSNEQDFPSMMRDITFPPDSGCGLDGRKKGTDMKPLQAYNFSGTGADSSNSSQHLKWQAHMVSSWMDLCDGALQDIPRVGFQVDTDKGFNYSIIDDSFVCQKKNHFQVTVTVSFPAVPKFVKMKSGLIKPIEKFSIHLHGVKFEQINSDIKLEQSKSDRSKTKYEPEIVEIPIEPGETVKRTMCRLHFSETTNNNMRKRGKPNPDQKYFSLVVALHADTADDSFLVVAHVSERIIVRASNPGNFDNDCDYSWFKSTNPEHIYHQGRVGINTEKPEEALSVHGNIQLTGQILQASDLRIKKNVRKLHSFPKKHLGTISRLQLYEYQLATATSDVCDVHRLCPQTAGVNCSATCTSISSRSADNHDDDGDTSIYGNSHSNGTGGRESTSVCRSDDARDCSWQDRRKIVGLLAQEVKTALPNAVIQTKQQVELSDGSRVDDLLVVDKDQVLMEVLGAVQELGETAEKQNDRLLVCEKRHLSISDVRQAQTANIRMTVHKEQEHSKPFLQQSMELTLSVRATTLQWLILALALIAFGFIISTFS